MTIIDLISTGEVTLSQIINLHRNLTNFIAVFAMNPQAGGAQLQFPDEPGTDIKLVGSTKIVTVLRDGVEKQLKEKVPKGGIIH